MPLDALTLRNAKPQAKSYKLADGGGLHVEVTPAGGKWWRYRYRFGGKEQQLSLGTFPDVSLKDARERRDDARRLVTNGVNPSEQRKARKAAGEGRAANSFEVVAREWFAKQSPLWEATYAEGIRARLDNDIFPWIGARPIDELTAPELLSVLRRLEKRGAIESAHRAKGNLGQVFRYGIATARCTRDPAADLRGALAAVQVRHHPAVTDPQELGQILRVMHGYSGTPVVVAALKLAPLLFVRPGELRTAQWVDIDLDDALWSYVVTKTKVAHMVPLATQAVEILRELQVLTGRGTYVFPGARTGQRPMSENGVTASLNRMELKDVVTGHGFRASARTILDEVLQVRVELIEHQLAHVVKDPNGRAYNRTKFLPQRRAMMQLWADYLDALREGRPFVREASESC